MKKMLRLNHWYINEYFVDTDTCTRLSGCEYLRDGAFFFKGYGIAADSPEFSEGRHIETSAIKKLEYIEDDELLRIHTQDSVYDCAAKDCDFRTQEPLDILPDSIRATASAYRPSRSYASELPAKNSILLVFASRSEFNYVDGLINRDGHISILEAYPHVGFHSDSFLLSEDFDEAPQKVDIRYFPAASREGKYIEFYSFDTDGLPVYLHNAGETPLSFLTDDGLMDVAPEERKLVSAGNVAVDSHERLEAAREAAREEMRRFLGRSGGGDSDGS